MKRKFENYPNQFKTREDCELYFSSRKAETEAPEGGECSVECIEDDTEEFDLMSGWKNRRGPSVN